MMPAYAIKYILKTGDVQYSDGNEYFSLSEGVKEKGFDWDADHIGGKIDQLIDSNTRVVIDTAKGLGKVAAYDWRQDATYINTIPNGSEWGNSYTIEHTPDIGATGGHELAIIMNSSNDDDILLKNDHIGLFHFKARAVYTTDESGSASFQLALQRRAQGDNAILTYSTALSTQLSIPLESGTSTQEWKDYYFVADAGSTELLAGSWIKFVPVGKAAKFEVTDIQLYDFGLRKDCQDKIELMKPKPGYKGIEEDHVWRQEAWNRIEKYRKEDIEIEVVDGSGQPVKDASVAVKMTENEFMYGAAISESEVVDDYIDLNTVRGQKLDNFMDNDINTGVAADRLKAHGIIMTDAKAGINMINEFISRGKRTRGHAILWDGESLMPFNRTNQMTYQEIYKNYIDYTRAISHTFAGKLDQWDVVNEAYASNDIRTKYNTTRLYTDVFKEVKKIDPFVKIYINETGMEGRPHKGYNDMVPSYLNLVKQMKTEGAPIEGIGIQAHCTNYYYPQGFYHQIDECAQVVDEVAITEYDLYNGDTEFAPNHLEDTFLALFSHPKGSAFIVWNIEDSMHWRWNANAAPFFNRQWEEKPAYYMWKKLTEEVFVTDVVVKTDENGRAKVRAYRGDYDITCSYNGKEKTVRLGNTADGASSVSFVVGNTISGSASNPPRAQREPIKFANMTEAKREIDSIAPPVYKGVILDRNFKGCETTALVINGGDVMADATYLKGLSWGSVNGMGALLAEGDWGASIIRANGNTQTGDIRLKAEGTERYEDTELHHETMFYTLNPEVAGTGKISAGISKGITDDTTLAEIIYDGGSYYINTVDGHKMRLEPDNFYSIDVGICGDTLEYVLTCNNEPAGTYSCTKAGMTAAAKEADSVFYSFDAHCNEGDIFKLHNARMYEYKEGEIIKFSDTDYDAYLLDESMSELVASEIEYVGKEFTEAPKTWKHAGYSANSAGFGTRNYGMYFGSLVHQADGEHSIAKGFEPIKAGDTLELTFDSFIMAPTYWMDVTGRGEISLGSYDESIMLDVMQNRYRQYDDVTARHRELWLLDVNNAGTPALNEHINYNSVFAQDRTDVKLTLSPATGGKTYDAYISVKPRIGEEEIIASYPDVLTNEQIEKIDTLFISSYVANSNSAHIGDMSFGVRNVKLLRRGDSVAADGAVSLKDGEKATLGIMYDNVTQIHNPASVIVAGYKYGKVSYCEVKEYMMESDEGGISFTVDASDENVDYYKVFVIDSSGSIRPYKGSDVINIVKE